jgi:uncharacterized membrane protein
MTTLQRPVRADVVVAHARRADREQGYAGVNVGYVDRAASAAVGLPMVALGLRRWSTGGLAMAAVGGYLAYRAATGYCPLYDMLELDSAHDAHAITHMHKGVFVKQSYTVNRSPEECYRFWRDFTNLPRFMTHLKSVRVLDDRRSRWEAKAPLGGSVSWDAEIINERPNELIAWRSVGEADVDNAGSVRFRPAPGDRGTEVTVEINYEAPGGRLGATIARLLGESPEVQVREDLRRFKQLLETGEIPTVAGQPSCRGSGRG